MESEEGAVPALYSSSTSAEGFKYDVYLSFRGRFAFIDFLYTNLVALGVRIFRDDIELRRGEEIVPVLLKAIAESKIYIPIFSKDYASSKWCLSELAKMVECKRSTGQLILPIFYDVKPSEVRHQSGTYEDAFKKHRRRFDQITVKKWEEAVREVGSLKGWEVEKETDGYQGKLINEIIIPTVLLELKKYYMNVTDNLVGMDHHEKEMMRLLNIGSDNVRLVGIHGMGGIGKTTIAKFIYGKLLEWFECCSFLADVRETVQQRDGFLSLQKQFLADTLEQHPDIADVNSGIDMIKRVFLRKKVLIVLDDVNEKSQFAILLGKHDQFGSGSRIIVTTREKHVLNALGVDGFYEPSCLNNVQSLQLFSIHAFRSIFPPKDYVSISREIVSATFGLPLALEIIGSFLSEKEEVLWEDTLKKLKNIPGLEVQKKLSISYEALNYEQQQIFLDIACFFVGMDKTYVSYMWDGCDYNPEKEINVLCLLSLVKIGDDNLLKMHDQIRDLGREIVRQESFKNPGNRSRLWNHKEALDILEGRRGTEKVEALSLHFELRPERKPRYTSKEFKKLENLRYLRVDGTELVGNFEHLLPKLRWLNWHGCPPHFKPTNFHLKNLVILDLSNSGITEDWGGWNQFKVVNKLKVLQLANCALRRTPDFSSYASLEILILRRCKSLLGIDPSIGNLKNLRVLDISYADIRKLPDEIWMLKKLEIIDASSCYYLGEGIPSNIGSLSSLRFLSVYNNKFQSLPPSIWGLSCLQTLELVGKRVQSLPELSWNLRTSEVAFIPSHTGFVNSQGLRLTGDFEFVEVPSSVGQLCSLERLFFDSTNIRNLPQDTFAFPQLKLIHLQFCHNLQLLPTLPSSLINFSLRVCPSLETLPDLSNLTNLQQLSLKNCIKLKEIPGLGNLESLRRLGLYACHKLANLDLLEQFPCLESLEMSGCKDFEVKPDLSNLKKLEIVSIADCAELNNIQGLGKLTSLKYLFLHHCMNLRWIEDLEDLKSLVALDVSGCALLNQHPGHSGKKTKIQHPASRMVSALAMTQLQDGYVSYPWERRMQEMVSVPNSSCFVSMLFLPKASDRVASRYNDLEDTLARANAWLNASQASGVPIVFMNIQTESLLTKISGDTASSIVNAGSLSDLSNLANASLYGFEDYHGLDIGVVRAVRLWYAPLGGEIAVEIKLKEGDAKLGFAISRTEEGFIYISSVIDGDDNAPATRSGLSDLYKQAVIASKLLVVSRISNQKVLPWIVSPTGAIRCFDTVSLSQKLSLHRHVKVPILIHALLWDQALASPSGGNTRHRTPSIPVLPLPSEIRPARPPKFSSKSEVQSDERELWPARDRKIFTLFD